MFLQLCRSLKGSRVVLKTLSSFSVATTSNVLLRAIALLYRVTTSLFLLTKKFFTSGLRLIKLQGTFLADLRF